MALPQSQYLDAQSKATSLAYAIATQTDKIRKEELEALFLDAQIEVYLKKAELQAAIETKALEAKAATDTEKDGARRVIAAKLLAAKHAAVSKRDEVRAAREAEQAKAKLAADTKETKKKRATDAKQVQKPKPISIAEARRQIAQSNENTAKTVAPKKVSGVEYMAAYDEPDRLQQLNNSAVKEMTSEQWDLATFLLGESFVSRIT